MSEADVSLCGKVLSVSHKRKQVFVEITGTQKVVPVCMREEDKNLTEDNDVLVRKDGTLKHLPCLETMSTASTNLEAADAQEIEMSTLEKCFAEASAQRGREGGFMVGEEQREIFSGLGLTFNKVKTVQGMFADLSESVDSDEEYVIWSATRDTVLEDTSGACSLAYSGPTSASADDTVVKQLVFSCGDQTCPCQGEKMYTLSHLMPTQVGSKKKDLCIDAFKKQVRADITTKAFKIGVASMRAGEKYAVEVNVFCLCLSLLYFMLKIVCFFFDFRK
jgi:hypothetical protein